MLRRPLLPSIHGFRGLCFVLEQQPIITAWASVAGKKEALGPLSNSIDILCEDSYFGQKTWEQGEKRMQQIALEKLAEKASMQQTDFNVVFSGDLLRLHGEDRTARDPDRPDGVLHPAPGRKNAGRRATYFRGAVSDPDVHPAEGAGSGA